MFPSGGGGDREMRMVSCLQGNRKNAAFNNSKTYLKVV